MFLSCHNKMPPNRFTILWIAALLLQLDLVMPKQAVPCEKVLSVDVSVDANGATATTTTQIDVEVNENHNSAAGYGYRYTGTGTSSLDEQEQTQHIINHVEGSEGGENDNNLEDVDEFEEDEEQEEQEEDNDYYYYVEKEEYDDAKDHGEGVTVENAETEEIEYRKEGKVNHVEGSEGGENDNLEDVDVDEFEEDKEQEEDNEYYYYVEKEEHDDDAKDGEGVAVENAEEIEYRKEGKEEKEEDDLEEEEKEEDGVEEEDFEEIEEEEEGFGGGGGEEEEYFEYYHPGNEDEDYIYNENSNIYQNSKASEYNDETIWEMWTQLNCDTYFQKERPIHPNSVWVEARELYKSLTLEHNNTLPEYDDDTTTGFTVAYEAKQSPGKGRGVFAKQDVKKGQLVYNSAQTARFDNGHAYKAFIMGLEPGFACDVLQWAFVIDMQNYDDEENEKMELLFVSVDLDPGCFCNDGYGEHSNVGCDREAVEGVPGGCRTNFFALRDIKAGEEFLCVYGEFVVEDGWQAFGLL